MEDFEREIERRAEAAVESYRRKHAGADGGRQRQLARESLAEVLRRFVRAEAYSGSRLRVHYLQRSGTDRATGYALVWDECPPMRELCIRLDEARGAIRWELSAPELRLSRTGSASAPDFVPELLDELIYALLEQDCWEKAIIPSLGPRSESTPTAD